MVQGFTHYLQLNINADISEILTRSSSAMMEANNSLADTIAVGTAATEITRDAASVGTALKTKPGEIVLNHDEYFAICVAASAELYPKRENSAACKC